MPNMQHDTSSSNIADEIKDEAKESASPPPAISQDLETKAKNLEMRLKKSHFLNFWGTVLFCGIIVFQFFFKMFDENTERKSFGDSVDAVIVAAVVTGGILVILLLTLWVFKAIFAIKGISGASTYADVESGVEVLETKLSQSYFFALGGGMIFLDVIAFQSFGENWAAPIAILFIELVLVIIVGGILGIKDIERFIDKILFAFGSGKGEEETPTSKADGDSTTPDKQ